MNYYDSYLEPGGCMELMGLSIWKGHNPHLGHGQIDWYQLSTVR